MRFYVKTMLFFVAQSLSVESPTTPGRAQTQERFVGTLSCAKSMFAKPARREPVTIEIAGNVARYRHTVLNEDGTAGVGMETGEGTVAKDGRVTLLGAWKSQARGYSYEARYSGTLGANGGELEGHQSWIVHGRKGERSCTMILTKSGRRLLR